MALVLLALGFAFERETRALRAQSERALVWSSMASLRTALVLNRLAQRVRPDDKSLAVQNPFLLLQQIPANFAGEVSIRDIHTVAPGSWVFDPACPCVGYRLLYPEWLEPAQEVGTIWMRITSSTQGGAGLTPQADYLWLGTRLK